MISIGHPIYLNILLYILDKGYNMKTLIISYLPRGERSKTKKILDAFIEEAKHKHAKLEILDLTKDVPDFFLSEKDRKSTRLNSSHSAKSRMPSSA